jgi:RNA recognition motif-containing protein
VTSVDLIMDKFSGRPRGFGFVTMESKEAADAAVQALNGKNVDGRDLTVNEARPREERAPRSGGGGGGGYRGGGSGGGDRGGRREYSR